MRWKSYRVIELPKEVQTETILDTLSLIDSGFVASYEINNDYIENENGTLNFVGTTITRSGDLISIIEDGQELFSGVVVTVDNEQHSIVFNSLLSLFDVDILNIYRDTQYHQVYEPVKEIVTQITTAFVNKSIDRRRRLPIKFITSGVGIFPSVWDREPNTLNLRDWLMDMFDVHNIVLQPRIVFEEALDFENSLSYILLRVFVNNKQQDVVKMNVPSMSITHSEVAEPSATVCKVLEKDTKQELATYYLTIDGEVTTNAQHQRRFELYKLVVAEYESLIQDGTDDNGNPIMIPNNKQTKVEAAQNKLTYQEFNHYLTVQTSKNNNLLSKMEIGDRVIIVHKVFIVTGDESIEDSEDEQEKYILSSIYTGKKESSESDTVTLTFGKIRVNYTDINIK